MCISPDFFLAQCQEKITPKNSGRRLKLKSRMTENGKEAMLNKENFKKAMKDGEFYRKFLENSRKQRKNGIFGRRRTELSELSVKLENFHENSERNEKTVKI